MAKRIEITIEDAGKPSVASRVFINGKEYCLKNDSTVSFREAALQVLAAAPLDSLFDLTVQQITEIAIRRGLISTVGKTPAASMGARIYVDIKRRGDRSPFVQVGPARFSLR